MVGIFVLDGVLDDLEAQICLPKGLRRVLDDIGEVRLRHSGMFAMFGNVLKEYSGCSGMFLRNIRDVREGRAPLARCTNLFEVEGSMGQGRSSLFQSN
jgi:hypothetical protein